MIGGLLAVVAMAIDACAKSGHPLVKAQNERAQAIIDAQPSARRLYLTALCQGNFDQEGADVLAGVLGVLYVARNVFQVSDPKVENEETAPPVMKVEIVGMPTRATETVIERDEDLEIASTRTVERDAA